MWAPSEEIILNVKNLPLCILCSAEIFFKTIHANPTTLMEHARKWNLPLMIPAFDIKRAKFCRKFYEFILKNKRKLLEAWHGIARVQQNVTTNKIWKSSQRFYACREYQHWWWLRKILPGESLALVPCCLLALDAPQKMKRQTCLTLLAFRCVLEDPTDLKFIRRNNDMPSTRFLHAWSCV